MPNAAAQMQPELLKAANRGDWRSLSDLMSEGVAAVVPEATADIEHGQPTAANSTHRHTYGPDSVLHVVASGGDDDKFLRSATLIYGRARHLLGAGNADGDTPLHCAARAGSVKMLNHLMDLARREDGGGGGGSCSRSSGLQLALRKPNLRGETVLHEAVRRGDEEMVRVLMSEHPAELARIPCADGASPLYLAILLERDAIAEQLHRMDNQLSYSGPDGQNALHVAALRSERMTKKLLAWNSNLTKEADKSSGRTPLHYAASWQFDAITPVHLLSNAFEMREAERRANLLLDSDESSAYRSDKNGLFPIHVAALGKNLYFVRMLLRKCPDCAQLRDGKGRTFLHIAVKKNTLHVMTSIRHLLLQGNQVRTLAAILNAQDHKGNTALHYAVMVQMPSIVCRLVWNEEVQLNLQNKNGQTALDLSLSTIPSGIVFTMDPDNRIFNLLRLAGAKYGVSHVDKQAHAPPPDLKAEAEKIKDSTATIGIASVLIVTVSFAAAFQLPGGYSTGNKPEGTPELANKGSFQAFVLFNNLAFVCGTIATIFLVYAGVTTVHITTRRFSFLASVAFLQASARSLVAAFAFGTQAVLAPVARTASVLMWVSVGFVFIDMVWFTCLACIDFLVIIRRVFL